MCLWFSICINIFITDNDWRMDYAIQDEKVSDKNPLGF